MDRMASVDRNIMRFAVFELLYRNDIPPAVTINESLEIAKKFSSSEAASFINGLLDKIARESRKKSKKVEA
jgi:N utilization substance protein B